MYRNSYNTPMSYGQERNVNHQQPLLKVIGEGSVTAAPDRVQILLGAITEEATVQSAQQENATIISAVIEAITGLGVPQESIQTSTYRIDPQYDFIEGEQVFRGYRVAHILQITLDQVEQSGAIIDAAVQQGANTVPSITFTFQDPSTFYQEALVEAIENANQKATIMSNTIGVSLNPIPLRVTEINKQAAVPYPTVLSAQAAVTPIQEGELTITAAVEVEFTYFP
ncbi:SIMPL domain-containing protein [Halalkalibacter flavus]